MRSPSNISSDDAALNDAAPDVAHVRADAAAVESWTCDEPLPDGPLSSQKNAIAAVKTYAVSQGFALRIYRSSRFGIRRVNLRCVQGKHFKNAHGRSMALTDRGSKKRLGVCMILR